MSLLLAFPSYVVRYRALCTVSPQKCLVWALVLRIRGKSTFLLICKPLIPHLLVKMFLICEFAAASLVHFDLSVSNTERVCLSQGDAWELPDFCQLTNMIKKA